MTTNPEIHRLAQQIHELRRQMRTQARAAQTPHRSVDISAGGTTYYGEDGTPIQRTGVQADGTFGTVNLDPSTPPSPTSPDVEPAIGSIRIIWDGTFIDSNWTAMISHIEIHVSDTPGFEATDLTQVGVFTSARGGEFVFPTPNDDSVWNVALVAVSHAGKESGKSTEASGFGLLTDEITLSLVDDVAAAQTTADGKNTIYYDLTPPVGGDYKVDDIWFDVDNGNLIHHWDGDSWESTSFGSPALGDSAVTTTKIADAAITNAKILDASIQNAKIANLDAAKVTTGTLSADRIAAGSIVGTKLSATAIDGKTITGATIQTSALANTGIKLAGSELVIYGSGAFSTVGVRLTPGSGGLKFFTVGSSLPTPGIYKDPGDGYLTLDYGPSSGGVRMHDKENQSGTLYNFTGSRFTTYTGDSSLNGVRFQVGLGVTTAATAPKQGLSLEIFDHDEYLTTTIFSDNAQTFIKGPKQSAAFVRCTDRVANQVDINGNTRLDGGVVTMGWAGNAGFISHAINATASVGTAVQINTSNAIVFRSSSGMKHKVDVRFLEDFLNEVGGDSFPSAGAPYLARDSAAAFIDLMDDINDPEPTRREMRLRVTDMRPIIYKDRAEVESHMDDDPQWEHVPRDWIGWSADDFAEAGWEELITRDRDTGEPENLHYERVLPVVVLELKAEIQALNERIETLEGPAQ